MMKKMESFCEEEARRLSLPSHFNTVAEYEPIFPV